MSSAGSASSAGSTSSSDPATTEWQAARDNISRFDGYLDNLRRGSFAVITTLLTLSSLLSTASPTWKAAALTAVLGLITVTALMDRYYQVFVRAAVARAEVLERRTDFNLVSFTSKFYADNRASLSFGALYPVLALLTFLLAVPVLAWSSSAVWTLVIPWPWPLVLTGIATIFSMVISGCATMLFSDNHQVFLETDKYSYVVGEPVAVFLTNFSRGKKEISLEQNNPVWAIYSEQEDGKSILISDLRPSTKILLGSGDDYRWTYSSTPERSKVTSKQPDEALRQPKETSKPPEELAPSLEPGPYRIVYVGPERPQESHWYDSLFKKKNEWSRRWRKAARIMVVAKTPPDPAAQPHDTIIITPVGSP